VRHSGRPPVWCTGLPVVACACGDRSWVAAACSPVPPSWASGRAWTIASA